jgi:hypothetical protein
MELGGELDSPPTIVIPVILIVALHTKSLHESLVCGLHNVIHCGSALIIQYPLIFPDLRFSFI